MEATQKRIESRTRSCLRCRKRHGLRVARPASIDCVDLTYQAVRCTESYDFTDAETFAGYIYVVGGGMGARQEPSAIEVFIAGKLVTLGIPTSDHVRTNPIANAATSDDVAAGRDLYQAHCEVCHAPDGSGKTAAGGGMYPRPPRLQRDALSKRADGDLFYLIRNGVRNSAMPGWQLPDRQTWQLVLWGAPATGASDATCRRSRRRSAT